MCAWAVPGLWEAEDQGAREGICHSFSHRTFLIRDSTHYPRSRALFGLQRATWKQIAALAWHQMTCSGDPWANQQRGRGLGFCLIVPTPLGRGRVFPVRPLPALCLEDPKGLCHRASSSPLTEGQCSNPFPSAAQPAPCVQVSHTLWSPSSLYASGGGGRHPGHRAPPARAAEAGRLRQQDRGQVVSPDPCLAGRIHTGSSLNTSKQGKRLG